MTEESVDRLKQIALFQKIKDNKVDLKRLMDISRPFRAKKGQTIIKEGDLGDEMYIVIKGGVRIEKRTRAGDTYTVVQLKAEQNVFFGEMALVDNDRRSATIVTSEDSEFLVISKPDFIKLGESYPNIALPITRSIAQILASRLRKTTEDMLTLFDALVNEIQDTT